MATATRPSFGSTVEAGAGDDLRCDAALCRSRAYEGGKQAVAEAWRNLTVTGARPLAVTDNLNFGNPQRPEIMGQIVRAIDGMAKACRALRFPVISGNVSLYNETNGQAIPPTPAIGGVGIIDDLERRASVNALQPGDALVLIGETNGHLGQSIYAQSMNLAGAAPKVDLALEKKNGDFVRSLIAEGVCAPPTTSRTGALRARSRKWRSHRM